MDVEPVEVAVEVTFPLRRRLLRDDRSDLDLRMPDDELDGSFHLAVLNGSGVAVGVATAVPSEPEFEAAAPSWRIRQMAVDPTRQGEGIGSALFIGILDRLRMRGAATVWAEARDASLQFYLRRGMAIVPGRDHVVGSVSYTDVVLSLR